ncbi:MAG: hypothetical protein LH481_05465 [Burkholderiales bacterium]|nr:hypothetical protein [Burkholderiales bacterium]
MSAGRPWSAGSRQVRCSLCQGHKYRRN